MRLDKEVGVSYRQLDWWTRQGYIHAQPGPGSGYARKYSDSEKQIATMMGQLVDAGFRAERAAFWARLAFESDCDLLELGNDIVLAFGKHSAGGNLGSNRIIAPSAGRLIPLQSHKTPNSSRPDPQDKVIGQEIAAPSPPIAPPT